MCPSLGERESAYWWLGGMGSVGAAVARARVHISRLHGWAAVCVHAPASRSTTQHPRTQHDARRSTSCTGGRWGAATRPTAGSMTTRCAAAAPASSLAPRPARYGAACSVARCCCICAGSCSSCHMRAAPPPTSHHPPTPPTTPPPNPSDPRPIRRPPLPRRVHPRRAPVRHRGRAPPVQHSQLPLRQPPRQRLHRRLGDRGARGPHGRGRRRAVRRAGAGGHRGGG